MLRMFSGAAAFQQNLSGWRVSNVTTANYMFCNCSGMLPPEYDSLKPPIIPTPDWGCIT
jgi:surface protein